MEEKGFLGQVLTQAKSVGSVDSQKSALGVDIAFFQKLQSVAFKFLEVNI